MVKGCFFLCVYGYPSFPHHLLKRLTFLYLIAFVPLSKIDYLCMNASIYGLSVLFH